MPNEVVFFIHANRTDVTAPSEETAIWEPVASANLLQKSSEAWEGTLNAIRGLYHNDVTERVN